MHTYTNTTIVRRSFLPAAAAGSFTSRTAETDALFEQLVLLLQESGVADSYCLLALRLLYEHHLDLSLHRGGQSAKASADVASDGRVDMHANSANPNR